MINKETKGIIKKVLKEYKEMRINELSLNSDIVSEFIDLVSTNPFVIKELGFKNMKHFKGYIEDCGYSEFSDIRDEVNHLIEKKKKD
jgi:hypothetical protein